MHRIRLWTLPSVVRGHRLTVARQQLASPHAAAGTSRNDPPDSSGPMPRWTPAGGQSPSTGPPVRWARYTCVITVQGNTQKGPPAATGAWEAGARQRAKPHRSTQTTYAQPACEDAERRRSCIVHTRTPLLAATTHQATLAAAAITHLDGGQVLHLCQPSTVGLTTKAAVGREFKRRLADAVAAGGVLPDCLQVVHCM